MKNLKQKEAVKIVESEELSKEKQELAKKIANQEADERAKRVAELKKQIKAGEYDISSEEIAGAMLKKLSD